MIIKKFQRIKVLLVFGVLMPIMVFAQKQLVVKWDINGLFLDNGVVSRYISFQDDGVRTISLRIPLASQNFLITEIQEPDWIIDKNNMFKKSRTRIGHDPLEFSFTLDNQLITGLSGWEISDIQNFNLNGGASLFFLSGSTKILKYTSF